MPNWVSNYLNISGPPEDIDRFVKVAGAMTRSERKDGPPKVVAVKGKRKAKVVEDCRRFRPEVLGFNHFIPQPRTFPKGIPKGHPGTPKWMRWRAKYWGTKWEPCWTVFKQVNGSRIRYRFCTAWYAPTEFFQRVSRVYPTLIFRLRYWQYGAWQPLCEFSKGKGYLVKCDNKETR